MPMKEQDAAADWPKEGEMVRDTVMENDPWQPDPHAIVVQREGPVAVIEFPNGIRVSRHPDELAKPKKGR